MLALTSIVGVAPVHGTTGNGLGAALPLQFGGAETAGAAGTPPYAGLPFVATFVSLVGVFLTLHGAAAYALLVWEGTAGVAAWPYVHPAVGGFFLAAAAFQVPMAAHLWGDPLRVRRRTGRALRALIVALNEQ